MSEQKIEFNYQAKLNELTKLNNAINLSSSPEQKALGLFQSLQLNMLIAFRLFTIGDPQHKCLDHYFKALKAYANLGETLQTNPSLENHLNTMHLLEMANQNVSEKAPFFNNILKTIESPLQTKLKNAAKLTTSKKYQDAHKVLKRLLSEHPDSPQVVSALLFIHIKINKFTVNDFKQAKHILENSAQLEPALSQEELYKLEYCAGFGYFHNKEYSLAADHLARIDSNNPAIIEDLPELLGICRFKQMQNCINELDNLDTTSKEAKTKIRQRDEYAEAATNLLSDVKNSPVAAYSIAKILDLYGNNSEAMIYYLQAKKSNIKLLDSIQVQLGNLYVEGQQYQEAIEEYSDYLSHVTKDTDPFLIQEITFRRSVAYARNGNIKGALDDLIKALEINPVNPICAISTQKLLSQNKAKLSEPSNGPDLQAMVEASTGTMQHFKEDDFQMVVDDLEKCLKHSTDRLMKSLVYCLIGHVQATHLKDLDKAIEAYQKAQTESPLHPDDQTRLKTLINLKTFREGRHNLLHTTKNKDENHAACGSSNNGLRIK